VTTPHKSEGAVSCCGQEEAAEHSKDQQLELQLQRERQEHEIRLLELQRSQNNQPQQQAYSSPPNGYPTPQPNPSVSASEPYPASTSNAKPHQIETVGKEIVPSTMLGGQQIKDPAAQPDPTNLILTSEKADISRRFSLQIDKSCNPNGIIIKIENATTVCARPTATYPPSRYMLTPNKLIRYQ
jgi:hypothetical protein